MEKKVEELQSNLKKYGQEHLLNHYETLDDTHKKQLLNQIDKIDFELVRNLYNHTKKEAKQGEDQITPIEYLDKYKLYDDYKYYDNMGGKAIKEGKLADLAPTMLELMELEKPQEMTGESLIEN